MMNEELIMPRSLPEDKEEAVLKLWLTMYGNGREGVVDDVKTVKDALIGTPGCEGLLTKVDHLIEKPRDLRLIVKDIIMYLTLAGIFIKVFEVI